MTLFFEKVRAILNTGAHLIRTANAWKIVWIIRAHFTLSNITLWRVVSQTIMRIIQEVRISEGQIIRAILY